MSYFSFYFFIVTCYLILGNVGKILPVTLTFGNLNLFEIILYLYTILFFIRYCKVLIYIKIFNLTILSILISLIVGIIKFGFLLDPILYNLRLIFLIITGTLFGLYLFKKYSSDVNGIFRYFLSLYSVISIISIAIYFYYPDSSQLWLDLSNYGIITNGDPHIGRLVSTYFDPNFYAAIICFPLILIFHDRSQINFNFKFIFFPLFLISLFLTYSRSGISTFLITSILSFTLLRFSNRNNFKLFYFLLLFALFVLAFFGFFDNIIDRFSTITTDYSAGARVESALIGLEIFFQQPIMGYGYHYSIAEIARLRGGGGLDSSLQILLIDFGLIGFILIAVYFFVTLRNIKINLKSLNNIFIFKFYVIFLIYLFTVIFFSSIFNNILFYPFWLIPNFGLIIYFYLMAYAKNHLNEKIL